jgi:hypothetical protein
MVGLALVAAVSCLAVAARLLVVRTLDGSLLVGWPGPTLGQFRVDAVLVACASGAALGASGAILQTLLRNPLASPFVLGVTSGAGAGVAFASLAASMAGIAAPTGAALGVPALAGALLALGCVLLLSRRHGALDPVTLILGGVIVGAIASAGSTVAESLLPPERRGLFNGWLFGRIPDVPDPGALAACAAAALALTGLGAAWGNRLDGAALQALPQHRVHERDALGVPLGEGQPRLDERPRERVWPGAARLRAGPLPQLERHTLPQERAEPEGRLRAGRQARHQALDALAPHGVQVVWQRGVGLARQSKPARSDDEPAALDPRPRVSYYFEPLNVMSRPAELAA